MLESRTMELLERIREFVRQNMEMETKFKENDEFEWDKHLETLLFYALRGLKPVGVNRYFMMTAIHDRFSSYIRKELSSKLIWDHLETLYGMAALHECEIIPFPNEEVDFELPEEVDEIVKDKFGVVLPRPPKDENEAPKITPNVKAMKKLSASKLKQTPTATANAKNAFQTPVSNKSTKNHVGNRSESKSSSAEIVKGKHESQLPGRINKVNRASSPFTTKNSKSDTLSSASESSTTPVSANKKNNKTENLGSQSSKKTPKNEPSSSNSSKKSAKSENNSSSHKQVKTETPDNVSKKLKYEKELSNKKGKVSLPTENSSKKSSKSDGKKTEADNTHKKSAETSKHKSEKEKGSSKGSKYDDLDTSHPSGSRKSGTGKVDTSDKKKKRQRVEESAKKGTAKRRRTLNS